MFKSFDTLVFMSDAVILHPPQAFERRHIPTFFRIWAWFLLGGITTGVTSGAVAGTTIFPLIGTFVGAITGIIIGSTGGFTIGLAVACASRGRNSLRQQLTYMINTATIAPFVVLIGVLIGLGVWAILNSFFVSPSDYVVAGVTIVLVCEIMVGSAWSAGFALRQTVTSEVQAEISARMHGWVMPFYVILITSALSGSLYWVVLAATNLFS